MNMAVTRVKIILLSVLSCISFSGFAQQDGIIRVACIGASITAGITLDNPAADAYPAQLQKMLGDKYQVLNFGVSGTTMLRKGDLPYRNATAYQKALQSDPEIVFIDLGGNDSKLINRVYLGEFEKDCHALIHSFAALPTHPRIILLLPLPCFLKDTTQINERTIVSQIIPGLRQVAYDENIEVLDMHSVFVDKESAMPDKIHPDLPGSRLIAERLFHLIVQTGDWQFNIFPALHRDFTRDSFNGYACANFTLDGKECRVVKPRWTAPGRPWIWRARFWGHEPQADIALLERGFHLVYCDVSELFGNEEAIGRWNDFYQLLRQAGLGQKAVLEGMSRGGVYVLNWAAVNPDKVSCVYIDNPVLDLKSWPAGLGRQAASLKELEILKADYHLKGDDDLRQFKGSPINKLPQIASGHYPILILCADADEAVPPEENTLLFERELKALQGDVRVLHKPGFKHHPHSLPDPAPIVDFILKATGFDQ